MKSLSPYSLRDNVIGEAVCDNLVDIYTGNYMYPFLKGCALPLNKTFLGHLNFTIGQPLVLNLPLYKEYFAAGTLDVYDVLCNKNIFLPSSDLADSLSAPFFEWYDSWSNLDQFKIFRHFYFPIDRDTPSWVNLFQITKTSFPHSSMLLDREDWTSLCDSVIFSTIDFMEKDNRLPLCSVDYSIWSNIYTPEQAMFRYYETTTGLIGFWTPADLILNYEIQRISSLLEKKPEEVLAIFSTWLSPTSSTNTLYFNFIETEGFDWINDPWYNVSYVF